MVSVDVKHHVYLLTYSKGGNTKHVSQGRQQQRLTAVKMVNMTIMVPDNPTLLLNIHGGVKAY